VAKRPETPGCNAARAFFLGNPTMSMQAVVEFTGQCRLVFPKGVRWAARHVNRRAIKAFSL